MIRAIKKRRNKWRAKGVSGADMRTLIKFERKLAMRVHQVIRVMMFVDKRIPYTDEGVAKIAKEMQDYLNARAWDRTYIRASITI